MKKLIFPLIIIILSNIGCNQPQKNVNISDSIRLNQIGYYPQSSKQFIVADSIASHFKIIDGNGKSVFEGELIDNGISEASGEGVLQGDFSKLTEEGLYYIQIDGNFTSYPFVIKENLYSEALVAAIKSYYYQRASMPIDEKFGGMWARKSGHPDNNCYYHPSSGRTEGILDSHGGWYDAGDYGKYIGNACLSTGQMLLLLEQFPDIIPDGALNIPESGNGIGDLYDELKYELDWILTMQDDDGGVYHKLTASTFSGFVMPEEYDLDRWIIGKGTAATLNFAAVLAQASRIYKNIDTHWSEIALDASQKAWVWALKNNDIEFNNPKDVSTGEYGDDYFGDDFYWAAAELYLTTKNEEYLNYLQQNNKHYIHELTNSWKFFIRNNAFHSLIENASQLDEVFINNLVQSHIKLADEILEQINANPYKIALNRFEWGSNSDILNQAVILCIAHNITNEDKYLIGAEQINDYIYGKNATGYCFLTGFGSKQVMFPHHRPSGADGIDEPIPGFIVGGPNNDRQDISQVHYLHAMPANSFMDEEESYASNEVCLNWNAPAVYVLGYLEKANRSHD
jgi:endoglucanase